MFDLPPRPTPHQAALHRITLLIAGGYLIALAAIALWPTPVDAGGHDWLVRALAVLHRHGAPGWLNYALVEFGSNIILFIPAGLFVVLLAGSHRWWLGLLLGFAVSCLIEVAQLLLLPARFATVNDVVANTVGAAIGSVIAVVVLWMLRRRHPQHPPL